jgi:hypothetical protein
MKSMITQVKDMLIKSGLIKRNRNASTSGKKDSGPTWLEEKPNEKGSALEEPRIETSGNQEKEGVASKR